MEESIKTGKNREFPGGPVLGNHAPTKGAWVWSLDGEFQQAPKCAAKKKKKKKTSKNILMK